MASGSEIPVQRKEEEEEEVYPAVRKTIQEQEGGLRATVLEILKQHFAEMDGNKITEQNWATEETEFDQGDTKRLVLGIMSEHFSKLGGKLEAHANQCTVYIFNLPVCYVH